MKFNEAKCHPMKYSLIIPFTTKPWKALIVSEYNQEIPQSQTADKPMAPRGRARQQSRDPGKTNDKLSKAIRSLFPIKVIAKLEWT